MILQAAPQITSGAIGLFARGLWATPEPEPCMVPANPFWAQVLAGKVLTAGDHGCTFRKSE